MMLGEDAHVVLGYDLSFKHVNKLVLLFYWQLRSCNRAHSKQRFVPRSRGPDFCNPRICRFFSGALGNLCPRLILMCQNGHPIALICSLKCQGVGERSMAARETHDASFFGRPDQLHQPHHTNHTNHTNQPYKNWSSPEIDEGSLILHLKNN